MRALTWQSADGVKAKLIDLDGNRTIPFRGGRNRSFQALSQIELRVDRRPIRSAIRMPP